VHEFNIYKNALAQLSTNLDVATDNCTIHSTRDTERGCEKENDTLRSTDTIFTALDLLNETAKNSKSSLISLVLNFDLDIFSAW